jgi:hypothetical protein
LTLGIVKIRRNGNYGLGNRFAELGFGGFLHFLKDESRNLLGRILLAMALNPRVAIRTFNDLVRRVLLVFIEYGVVKPASYQTLDGIERIRRVCDGLTFGWQPDQTFIIGGKRYDRRRGVGTFGIFQNARLRPLHHRDARIGRTKIDTDNFAHTSNSLCWRTA